VRQSSSVIILQRKANEIFILANTYRSNSIFWMTKFRFGQKNEALYEEPYVLIYGRDRCGWTQKYLKDLEAEEIEPIYEIVDKQEVSDELHTRMEKAGLSTISYGLPVIDVNGQLFIRPNLNKILTIYDM
jgi:hypothetical protein